MLSCLSRAAAEVAVALPGRARYPGHTTCERRTMARHAAILSFILGVCAAVPAAAQDSELVGYTAITRNCAAGVLVFN